jgi:hypothetical protein
MGKWDYILKKVKLLGVYYCDIIVQLFIFHKPQK